MNTCAKLLVISLYCLVGILEYFLIRISKTTGNNFQNSTVVVLVEISKLLVSAFLYAVLKSDENSSRIIFYELTKRDNLKTGYLYAIPAFFYAIYNNLTLFNLGKVEPSTFQIFMQSRLFITSILVYFMLDRPLKLEKWLALILLASGICLKNYQFLYLDKTNYLVVCYILFQAGLSSFSSAINEKLFKQDMGQSIFLQNGYLYFFGSIFNIIFNYKHNHYSQDLLNPYFWAIVICGVTVGLCASFIIKHLDTVIKSVYSTLEIPLTAIISAFILGTNLSQLDILSCIIVSFAVCWYSALISCSRKILESKLYVESHMLRGELTL